jgi:hypothetical protein
MGNAAKERRDAGYLHTWRISVLGVWYPHGHPLIGTQVPIQANVASNDYTCTTATGEMLPDDTREASLAKVLAKTFWGGSYILPYEAAQLNKKPLPSRGKQYWWQLVTFPADTRFALNEFEIQRIDWSCPKALPDQIRLMRPGRKEMFLHCLSLAIGVDTRLEVFRPSLNQVRKRQA